MEAFDVAETQGIVNVKREGKVPKPRRRLRERLGKGAYERPNSRRQVGVQQPLDRLVRANVVFNEPGGAVAAIDRKTVAVNAGCKRKIPSTAMQQRGLISIATLALLARSSTGDQCLPNNGIINNADAVTCMRGGKTFNHPALCPLEALCARWEENTEKWRCQSNYPEQCYTWTQEDLNNIASNKVDQTAQLQSQTSGRIKARKIGTTAYDFTCVFPFTYNGAKYDYCTTIDNAGRYSTDELPWCAVGIDQNGEMRSGSGNWGYCEDVDYDKLITVERYNKVKANRPEKNLYNLSCVFPFKAYFSQQSGHAYHDCTRYWSWGMTDRPWCATKIDENGYVDINNGDYAWCEYQTQEQRDRNMIAGEQLAEKKECEDLGHNWVAEMDDATKAVQYPHCSAECYCCRTTPVSRPADCNPSSDVMLWGRQTRPRHTSNTGNPACLNDDMCQEEGKKCYARQCVDKKEEGSDEERLHTYVTGACGTISPHAVANFGFSPTNYLAYEISCTINNATGDLGIDKHFPNRYGDVIDGNNYDYFNGIEFNRYGQLIVPHTWDDKTDYDMAERNFDTRAKAQACMLCSLYTARHFGHHAFIKDGEFAKCTVYPGDYDDAIDGENCTQLFGDSIFIAREGYREVETLDPEDDSPAYLLSGMVPTDITHTWAPFNVMPPLYSATKVPYLQHYNVHLMPQFAGLYESMNPNRETIYTRVSNDEEWVGQPEDFFYKNPNFAIMWDFVNFATTKTYSTLTANEVDEYYFPMNANIFYRPNVRDPNITPKTQLEDLIPNDLCKLQYSYCCNNGPELEGVALRPQGERIMRCGKFNMLSYGLNHPYRAVKCKIDGSNAESEGDQKEYFYEHYIPVVQPSQRSGGSVNFAADVLIVPRTYDKQARIYGWAKVEDLYDVDRAPDTCKYRPGEKDYCLRRDRGRAISKVNGLGVRCRQVDLSLMETSEPTGETGICELQDTACVEYVGTGSTTTISPTTTQTTTTTTTFAIGILDVVRYFTVYGVGGAHLRNTFQWRQGNFVFSHGQTTATPATTWEDGPFTGGGAYPWAFFESEARRCCLELRPEIKVTDETNTNIQQLWLYKDPQTQQTGTPLDFEYNESVVINSSYYGLQGFTLAVDETAAQQVPIFLAFVDDSGTEGEAAVIYPAGAQKGVCGVYYRYSAIDAPETLFSIMLVDGRTLAHTRCRDLCTAWNGCLAYSFDTPQCKLYSKYTVVKDSQYPYQLPFEWYRNGSPYKYLPHSVFWEGSSGSWNTEPTLKDTALLEYLGYGVKMETKFDDNALHRDVIPATENSGLSAPGAFDIYAGYSFCPTAGQHKTNTRKGMTLQECLFEAGAVNTSAFVWYGRLDSCVLYPEPFQNPVRVANAYPNPPRGPLAKCNAVGDVPANTIEIGIQELDDKASLPVIGLASENRDLKCLEASLRTTTTRTVASRTSVAAQKAVYASIFRWCHTDEPRWIYPVYNNDDHDGISYTVDETIEDFGDTVYIELKVGAQCTELPPSGYELFGLSNATATTTPTTTATTTTPTFVNKFTEADTAVTIGVVAGVIGIGIILILLRVAGC